MSGKVRVCMYTLSSTAAGTWCVRRTFDVRAVTPKRNRLSGCSTQLRACCSLYCAPTRYIIIFYTSVHVLWQWRTNDSPNAKWKPECVICVSSKWYHTELWVLFLKIRRHSYSFIRLDVLIGEDEDGRLISLDGSEFHQGLAVASGIESHRDVLGPVLVEEEHAS